MMNGKFGGLGVEIKPTRWFIVLPNEVEPLKDENGVEAYIDFLPWDSEPGRRFDQQQQREAVRKVWRRNQEAQRAELENADQIKDQAERLATLATGWHLVDLNGKDLEVEFSKENAFEFFSTPELGWLRRRAWVWVSDETNFMRRSSKNSSPSPSTNSSSNGAADQPAPNANT